MFAREVHDLRHFGLCHLVCIDTALANSMMMHMQHNSCGGFVVFAEESLQHVNNELHGRVVIVEDENAIHIRPLGLRLGLANDRGAGPALLVPALPIIIGHSVRTATWQGKTRWTILPDWGRHSKTKANSIPGGCTLAAPAPGQATS
jgi:hypothetical protein